MKTETIPLRERLIVQEAELDRQFSGHTVTSARLSKATDLAMVEVLTPDQVGMYNDVRGYSGRR
jgi:hypothetical protein